MERFTQAITRLWENSVSRQPLQSFRGETVPVFDPEDRNQTAEKWCKKIDELQQLYQWNEESTIYFALPKLKGFAETWKTTARERR